MEKALVPSSSSSGRAVMDGLSAHEDGGVREPIEGRGRELVRPPPHSPGTNPIGQTFGKREGPLRGAGARAREAPIEAGVVALSALTAQDARGFSGRRGRRTLAQPPRRVLHTAYSC